MQDNDPLIFKCCEIREKGALRVELAPSPAYFADAFDTPQTLKSLRVDLSFSIVDGPILLEGRVDAELNLECARCAAPVTRKFSDTFDELYPDTVEYIDTRERIRETTALLVPLKVVCSQACKGRCPLCGIELNARTCACKIAKVLPFEALKDFSVRKNTPRSDKGKPAKDGGK